VTRKLRVLVVDDDPEARRYLEELLREEGQEDVEAVDSAEAALERLRQGPVDALFLDIRMPGLSGLDLLRGLSGLPRKPRVVLVSGFEDHALEAFEAAAFDYLLKPVDRSRLRKTLERLFQEEPVHPTRVAVPTEDRVVLVDPADILYVQAQGENCRVVTRSGTLEARCPVGQLLRRLPPAQFLRVHRSFVVNLDCVREVHPYFSGTLLLKLDDDRGTEIPVSRTAARALRLLLHL
jgi:DNA-binding LytR/AlgR family response regulator